MRKNILMEPVGFPGRLHPLQRWIAADSGGGGNTTSTTQNYSPEEAARRARVMDEADRIYTTTAPTITNAAYPGAAPVPFSQETLAAQDYAKRYAVGPAVQQAANMNNAVQFGLKDVLFPQTNPALQSSIDAAIRPITQSYTDTGGVLSQIRDGAVNSGQFGSSRQAIAEGIAAGRYANTVADTASKMANENYQKGLDTFSRTLAFAPQALQSGLMPSNILSGVGAQSEMQAAQLEDYAANARMWDLNAPWAPLQNYASIVFGGANPSTVSQVNRGDPSALQTVGSIGSAILPFAMMMLSDRRLKRDIELIARDEVTGFNIYEFAYLGTPEIRYRGVMADEVKEVRPDAVITDPDGFMRVNYGALGIPFIRVPKGEAHV